MWRRLFCLANDLISIIDKHEYCVHNVLLLDLVELEIQRSVRAKFSVGTHRLGSPSKDRQRSFN